MEFKSIAIDGPSGAGKSTLARRLAEAMGYLYVDTGAIYRTLGLAARRDGVEPEDEKAVMELLRRISIRSEARRGRSSAYVSGRRGCEHRHSGTGESPNMPPVFPPSRVCGPS